jgi:2-amino-4-hydroxy-6-hydroxymethyldihydropteridine diphosphokinase
VPIPNIVRAYVGLGSNLADPVQQVRAAMHALAGLPDTQVERCSSLYLSKAIGNTAQPDFVNAACRLATRLSAAALLERLLALEAARGRTRVAGSTGGPRVLDLDLLLYGDAEIHEPGLIVPHPRLHERAFVLYPLLEIDRQVRVPGRGPAEVLARNCTDQVIERWEEAHDG